MKLCVQARQDPKYIKWASEIIFEYRDRAAIPDFFKNYPDHTIILTCFESKEDIDWNQLEEFAKLGKGEKFLLRIRDLRLIEPCILHNILFYFAYPITSYDELNVALSLGSYYVRLGAPLFFDLDNVKKYFPEARIRAIPNVAYDDAYPRENGVAGTWIRPEDITIYEDYIDAIEFNDADLAKERALIRIYWTEREWPGDLRTLITNLQYDGVNRMIHSDVTEARLNCRQRCMAQHNCHICYRALQLANEELIAAYRDTVQPKYQAPKKDN